MAKPVKTGTIEANGTRLYYELRGEGPSLLFVSGAEGDAEEWARVAPLLDDEFAVLSYDRRGFSRSQKPLGGAGTSVEEQADDAAALLSALNMAPAAVWGNSSGALISLGLVLRHPEAVMKAMLHEPPVFAGIRDLPQVLAFLRENCAQGKVQFLRMFFGSEVYDGFSADYRARLQADETWICHEFDKLEYYRPTDEELSKVKKPVVLLFGEDSPPFFGEVATWLAGRLGNAEVSTIPGDHGVHYRHPEEVAKAIRKLMLAVDESRRA